MKPLPEIGSKVWQVEVLWRAPRNPQVHIHYCGPVIRATLHQVQIQGSQVMTPRTLLARDFTLPSIGKDSAGKGRGHFIFYATSMEEARSMRRRFLRQLQQINKTVARRLEFPQPLKRVS